MLNYQKLASTGDTSINISVFSDNNIKNRDNNEEYADFVTQNSVNKIINKEKEAYEPKSSYKLNFNFWNGNNYTNNWAGATFVLPAELNKNVFKKSFFLIEFYDSKLETNNLVFNTTVNIYPANGKGVDAVTIGKDTTPSTTFTVSKTVNDLYLLYFNRDLDSFGSTQTDNNGKYIPLFMKILFLNAKNGKVQYFTQTTKSQPVETKNFSQSIFYTEIRFYENFSYQFIDSGNNVMTDLNFNEIVIR